MAAHLRTQIRNAAAAALTGLATTGANVFKSRREDIQDANLPALRIYTDDEDVRGKTAGNNPIYDRLCELVVEGCAKQNAALDDLLAQIALEVEVALAANQSIGGAKSAFLTRSEIELDAGAEKDRGVVKLTFIVNYYAAAGSPDVAL